MPTTIKKMCADFRTSLSAKIAVGGTSGTLQNNLDDDGVALPNGDYFFTIDADNSQKEHIQATLTGSNLTAISSVSRQGVVTSGTVREHRIGATVTITDFAHILIHNKQLNGDTALENKIKYASNLTFTDDKELVPKKYVDDIAIAGSPDATTLIKGIGTISSAPASPTAPVFLNAEEVSASGGTGAGEDKVVRANASGYIDKDFIELGTDPGLEFVSNGLEAKIKSAGGLVKDSNGLSVDTGTTDGKIVQMTTGDKLPAVDGSNLTNLSANAKIIVSTTGVTLASSNVETVLATTTISGGLLGTSNAVKITIPFSVFKANNNTGGTVNFRLKYGTTTVATATCVDIAATGTVSGKIEAFLMASGATNSQVGIIKGVGMASNVYNDLAKFLNLYHNGTATEDSTVNKTLSVTIQFPNASAEMAITTQGFIIESIK